MAKHVSSFRRSGALAGSALAACLATSVVAWLELSTGCDKLTSDQFLCGEPTEADPTKARICDQAGEVCVCGENRCALPDPSCPGSSLRYSFSPQDCVDAGAAAFALPQSQAGATFCPGAAGKCGQPGGGVCPQNQACVCAAHMCAERDDTGCDGGLRYTQTGECVAVADTRPEALVYWQGGADGGGTLCPDYLPLTPPCGTPMPGGSPGTCAQGERCVCAQSQFRCALPSESSQCQPSGYAWDQGRGCVGGLTKAEIEDPKNQVNDAGLCPQFVSDTDAGKGTGGSGTGGGGTGGKGTGGGSTGGGGNGTGGKSP
jgi:uncharacterized membrane protein YgcG